MKRWSLPLVALIALLLAAPAAAANMTVLVGEDTFYLTTGTTDGSCSSELNFHYVLATCVDAGDKIVYDSRKGCSNSTGSAACIVNVQDSPGSSNQLNCQGDGPRRSSRSYNVSSGTHGSNSCASSESGTSMLCHDTTMTAPPRFGPTLRVGGDFSEADLPAHLGTSRRSGDDARQATRGDDAHSASIFVSCEKGCGASTGSACCCEVGTAGCGGGTKCNGS